MARSNARGAHRAESHPDTCHLATKAVDQVTYLTMTVQAYLALEKLITPEHLEDANESVTPSRAELGALLRSVNMELQRQVHQLADTTTVLEVLVRSPPSACPPWTAAAPGAGTG